MSTIRGSGVGLTDARGTHGFAKDLAVFTKVGDHDPPRIVNQELRLGEEPVHNSRLGRLGEDFFPQLARAAALDGVQVCIDPFQSESQHNWRESSRASYSSAPSMVTSITGYCETSPSVRPAMTISSCDWKPMKRTQGQLEPYDMRQTEERAQAVSEKEIS